MREAMPLRRAGRRLAYVYFSEDATDLKRVLLLGLISGVSLFGYASTSLANGLARAAAALSIRRAG
jgi:hypothetical protein